MIDLQLLIAKLPRPLARPARLAWATLSELSRDNGTLLAAAIAFYATFSLGPILVLLLALGGAILGEGEAAQTVANLVGGYMGPRTARAVERMIAAIAESDASFAGWLSIGFLFFGASGVFRHVKTALNIVLDVPDPEETLKHWIMSRIVAVLMVGATIALFASSFALTATLAWTRRALPLSDGAAPLWSAIDLAIAATVTTGVFALVIKYVPDVRVGWSHIFVGAVTGGILFTAGRFALALFLSRSSLTDLYGAATSLFVILVAVYFGAFVLLLAAELAEVHARDDAEFRKEREERRAEAGKAARKV